MMIFERPTVNECTAGRIGSQHRSAWERRRLGAPNAREPSYPEVGGHSTRLLVLDVEADVSRLIDFEPPPARGTIGVLKGRPDLPAFHHSKHAGII